MQGRLFITTIVLLTAAATSAAAQTLYNSPTGAPASRAPSTNTQPVFPGAAAPKNKVPYAAPGQIDPNNRAAFLARLEALNDWTKQRDAQAVRDQIASREYMGALAVTPHPQIYGALETAGPLSLPANGGASTATGRMIYREESGIEKPRRLFNSVE